MKPSCCSTSRRRAVWLGLGLAAGSAVVAAFENRRRAARRQAWERQMAAESRTALVTGASSGIGQAYTRRLAAQSYKVVLVARRKERLEELAAGFRQSYGVEAEVLPADLSTQEGIAMVERRISQKGDIDFLVNNAGYDEFGPFAATPADKLVGLINCLALAGVRLSRAALPEMLARRRGAIVNVSSIVSFAPMPGEAAYASSKAFLNMFSESLAMELAGTGVRVQALCPGFTISEFHDAPQYAPYRLRERLPRGLWMAPEAVVEASLRALGEDRRICVPGWTNRLVALAGRTGLSRTVLEALRGFFPPASPPKTPALDRLACPECRGGLALQGGWENGRLSCTSCGKVYPVIDGIPRFIRYEELPALNRRFARFYDWFSYVYRPFSRIGGAFLGGEEKTRREILDRLDPKGGRVLEVSIGPGVNLPYLAANPAVGEIYGLDISLGQLQRCRSFAARHAYGVSLHLGAAEALPFQDESFESVFHIGGINFFSDKKKAIEEMIRVAKPGTKILIADETERGARGYEIAFPGFGRLFERKRDPVRPPVELVPAEMEDIRLDETVWKGWFYCIEFRKPVAEPDKLR